MLDLINCAQLISSFVVKKYGSREYIPSQYEFEAFVKCFEQAIIETLEYQYVISAINNMVAKYNHFTFDEAAKVVLEYGVPHDILMKHIMHHISTNNNTKKFVFNYDENKNAYERFLEEYK